MTRRLLHLVALAALLAPPAFSQTSPPTGPVAGAEQRMGEAMTRMQRDMSAMPMTGHADRDWAMMMRRHHMGALEMSQAYLAAGRDAETVRMARKVIEDQTREIADLDDWLRRHPG
ncbi:DUF305 domain-containing protein [Paeniroseomonas aquatica]|uniref:DUF305 domain-containing protein n=1 Tax=Paeniroseomonas aquatica TaxID=373043 RepID=A0ABT7ZZH0_9PROT|nr:DUF305 domain-containing protein [Paeniroseomonas aquatica]MDN3562868.1 DUF305 domain-containing protein [Paeniroseomonas aquatica]